MDITFIDIEKVYNITLDNLIQSSIIAEKDRNYYHMVLESMSPEELIETLLNSHTIIENIKRLHELYHLLERRN